MVHRAAIRDLKEARGRGLYRFFTIKHKDAFRLTKPFQQLGQSLQDLPSPRFSFSSEIKEQWLLGESQIRAKKGLIQSNFHNLELSLNSLNNAKSLCHSCSDSVLHLKMIVDIHREWHLYVRRASMHLHDTASHDHCSKSLRVIGREFSKHIFDRLLA
jgi:hypothetical protein